MNKKQLCAVLQNHTNLLKGKKKDFLKFLIRTIFPSVKQTKRKISKLKTRNQFYLFFFSYSLTMKNVLTPENDEFFEPTSCFMPLKT